jgi:hypothetical protein
MILRWRLSDNGGYVRDTENYIPNFGWFRYIDPVTFDIENEYAKYIISKRDEIDRATFGSWNVGDVYLRGMKVEELCITDQVVLTFENRDQIFDISFAEDLTISKDEWEHIIKTIEAIIV